MVAMQKVNSPQSTVYRKKKEREKRYYSIFKKICITIFFSFLFLWTVDCGLLTSYAADLNFEISVDDTVVPLGGSTQLKLHFYGTQDIAAPDVPDLDGFEVRYVGPSRSVSIVNRQVSLSVTHIYTLIPVEKGMHTIGPFTFEYEGREYASDLLKVEVVDRGTFAGSRQGPARGQRPAASKEDISGRLYLTMQVPRETVYVNEIIPMTIKLYVSDMGLKDIQYPTVSHEGFSMAKFDKPKQYRERDYNQNIFDVIEFKTTLFGTRPGEFTLGPAELDATRFTRKRRRGLRTMDSFFGDEFFDDFFDRYETHPVHLSSRPVDITVLPFPDEGRPESFNGTIGDFNFSLEARPREVKAGDPITLTMRVTGSGNFNTVTAPVMESAEGFKVYDPTVIDEKRGEKVFERVIIPTNSGVQRIPRISFGFFNPEREIYQVITRGSESVTVKKPDEEEELKIVEFQKGAPRRFVEEKLGKDIIYIKESAGGLRKIAPPLYRNKGFIAFLALPLFLLGILLASHRRIERIRTDSKYARMLHAPGRAKAGLREAQRLLKAGKQEEFYGSVFKTLQEYIGDKYQLAPGGITASIVDEYLKPGGIDEKVLSGLRGIFADCDMARYAASDLTRDDMRRTYAALRDVISHMQRHRG